MRRWWAGVVFIALVVLGLGAKWLIERPDPRIMHVFPGVHGPGRKSRIPEPSAARISDFERGGDHRLAILVTDPDSGWLGLVRGFRAHGVPITVTEDPGRALRHKVVLVYPIVSGRALDGAALRALAQHVRTGGTVLAFNLAGGGLEELFGVSAGAELSTRTRMRWAVRTGAPERDETAVSSRGETRIASIGYRPTTAEVAATFEDGSTAAACRVVGGRACVLGVDLGSLAQRAMNGRAEVVSRSYVNGYEPSLDVLFRWVRDLYVAGEPMPWLISTAPAGKQVSILFTHDVDAGAAPQNAVVYADALRARGIGGTFFVQTKYMKDYNDVAFFDEAAVRATRGLVERGMDVGSHTVAHSRRFEVMPIGSGRERYPAYRPFVESEWTVRKASILGELRVSKFLLENQAGAHVQAFRPGRLSYPFNLPQALTATGYRYSSSLTANLVMSHLPFQLTYDRADSALTPVWEFPVTIEDERPPALAERLDAADRLVAQIAVDHGVVNLLVHPNVVGAKLPFETALADRWAGRAWMGSVSAFGEWWRARDALETDVLFENGRWSFRAASPGGVSGVSVVLPKARQRELRVALPAKGRLDMALSSQEP